MTSTSKKFLVRPLKTQINPYVLKSLLHVENEEWRSFWYKYIKATPGR